MARAPQPPHLVLTAERGWRPVQPALSAYRQIWLCSRKNSSSSGSGSHVSHSRSGRLSVFAATLNPQPASSSPAQPCPLHACLLQYGIKDLAAVSAPKHLALSQGAVSSDVEPKLAALAAEGLSPKQIAGLLLARTTASLLSCSYKDTFQPNLQVLREIAAHSEYRPHPKAAQLTAVGKVLATSPCPVATYLCRHPSKVQQLLQCLKTDLGIGLKQLASCSALGECLLMSSSTAHAVIAALLERGVPVQQVARMALAQPTLFKRSPTTLAAKLAALEEMLDLDAAAALQLAVVKPALLSYDIKARLPALLRFLDAYMGEEGAGPRLVRASPVLGTITAAAAERSTDSLAARGYSQEAIRGVIGKQPMLLALNLDSPLQRQKLTWIERMSPWPLDDFLDKPQYFSGAKTRRLAARLALLHTCGLYPSPTPGVLAIYSDMRFMLHVRKRQARQGRELPWASWAEWEEAWLGTEVGREWGFLPLKE